MSNSNSYGVREVPIDAIFGVYDTDNGEWTGIWFVSLEAAEAAADQWDDIERDIMSVDDTDGGVCLTR